MIRRCHRLIIHIFYKSENKIKERAEILLRDSMDLVTEPINRTFGIASTMPRNA